MNAVDWDQASPKAKPRWHFSLRQVFIAVAMINVFLALIAWRGFFGAVVFAEACGIASVAFGVLSRKGHYFVFGLSLSVIAGGLLAVGSLPLARGCGQSTQPCVIEVVDQTTGNAVANATVRLRDVQDFIWPEDVPIQPIPAGEQGVSCATDGRGTAILTHTFGYSERTGLFVNEAGLSISGLLWLQVDAPGYEQEVVPLNSFFGRSYDYHRLPFPKIKIQLKRR